MDNFTVMHILEANDNIADEKLCFFLREKTFVSEMVT